MCNNAMVYNHPDTIYYKAAKRLLHVGLRAMTPEKIRPLASVLPSLARLTRRELGFELNLPPPQPPPQPLVSTPATAQASATGEAQAKTEGEEETPMEGIVEGGVTNSNEGESRVTGAEEEEDDFEEGDDSGRRELKRRSARTKPGSKFEAIVDDLTPEEILAQARKAAATAAHKLTLKRAGAKRKDGTTSLAVLIPSDGVAPGTNEKPVSLGALVGKLTHGTGQLQGFREDRRNAAKTVKPLYYGSFGSYAPSYDSTFANLTKEESDLVYSTYGDETAVQYAESILDFAKDCDYALKMVDNLLDIVTGGEHRRTMRILEENRRKARGEGGPDDEGGRYKRYLQDAEKTSSTTQTGITDNSASKPSVPIQNSSAPDSINSGSNSSSDPYDVKIDFEALKTLSDVGIDVSFLENVENELKNEALQRGLDQTGELLGKLEQVQRERLSQPPPSHLSLVAKPSEIEVQLAEKITENLTDMAKRVTPEAIVPLPAIRKAMGIAPTGIGVMHTIPTNSTIRINEDVAVEDDEEEEENRNARLPGSDSSQNVATSLAVGSVSSDPKLAGSVNEVVMDSSEKRMLGASGKDVEDMVSKLHEGVLDEVRVEDSGLEQPIKMDESVQSKIGSDHEISRTMKEEISEDKVQETTPSLNTVVEVGNRENILISDIKVESSDQVDIERHNPEKDSVLFGKPGEMIPKQEMVGQSHMGSECILGGRDDNVLGSIPVLGDAACVELGAILAGSDSKDNLAKVQVEGSSLSDVRAVSGGMVTEGISMVSSGNSSLASNVVVSSHLSTSGNPLVRSSNSMMSSRSGTSNGGMSVVVVEAGGVVEEVEVPDLESELREFLENEPALGGSPLQDDKTIEEILSES
ncbi:hypothetical protein J437_LFUL004713 [Ladona fulva]|uniref:Bromodomain-containing protein 7 n=1 Tax=Ladona fulva TaxID=123851 RepID=A0A8K0KYD3_LADFU|nr:hypothetical protein J437_LFUL004713 [Ladona fulva]